MSGAAARELVRSLPTDVPAELGSTALWAFHAPRTDRPSSSVWYVAADQQAATAERANRLARQAAHDSEEAVAQRAREAAEHLSALRKERKKAELDPQIPPTPAPLAGSWRIRCCWRSACSAR